MTIKIITHVMPWEIDSFLLTSHTLKQSSFLLNGVDKIIVEPTLNLSSYIIKWDESKIPKEFFIDKYKSIKKMYNWCDVIFNLYDGDSNYGFINAERHAYNNSDGIDGFMYIHPNIHFHKTLLPTMLSFINHVKDKYFMITTEVHKMWDESWDEITNKKYIKKQYDSCYNFDPYELDFVIEENIVTNNIFLDKVHNYKFAGWFDFINTNLAKIIDIPEDWTGYLPWDSYRMALLSNYKSITNRNDFIQYIIRNQIVFNRLNTIGNNEYIKILKINDTKLESKIKFENNMLAYVTHGLDLLLSKNIS